MFRHQRGNVPAVIAALLARHVPPVARAARQSAVLAHFREGVAYAMGFAPIWAMLLLLAAISLLGMSYNVLMPVFAKDVLHGGPQTYGLLLAATGVGAIGGAVFLALRRSVRGLGRVVAATGLLFGAALIGFGWSTNLYVSVALLVVAGFGMMVQHAGSNSLIQTLVDDDKRGRVMSLYVMAFMGMGPIGSLLAGWGAGLLGAPTAVAIGGTGCIPAAGLFATQLPRLGRLAHPTYVRLGMVPDLTANGNGETAEVTAADEVRL